MENYYDILGVPHKASIEEIKIAFRKLAILYHPDKNPETKDLFVKILQAYEVLSNPILKEKYDKSMYHTHQTYTAPTQKEKRDKWEVTAQDEKRRQYYKEYFEKLKKEYQKEKQKYEQTNTPYHEWKYWIIAILICATIFLITTINYSKK